MSDSSLRLLVHGGVVACEGSDTSFVAMFRPYRGLKLSTYADMMESVFEEIRYLDSSGDCRRDAMAAVASIWRVLFNFVLRTGAPLVANGLLSQEDHGIVEAWISAYSGALEAGLNHGFTPFIAAKYFEVLSDSHSSLTFTLGEATESLVLLAIKSEDPDQQIPAIQVAAKADIRSAIPIIRSLCRSNADDVSMAAIKAIELLCREK
jgi:hypothetical protein